MDKTEQMLEARDRRRGAAQDRFLTRLEKRERKAESLVGELCRDGLTIHYINERSKSGRLTGHTREFTGPTGYGSAISFLLRNRYV